METILPLLCGHAAPSTTARWLRKARCPRCASFWDLDAVAGKFEYEDSYSQKRRHFDREVGELKRMTLERWLTQLEIDCEGVAACEVGFGGAHCLKYLSDNGSDAFGIEAADANLRHAGEMGIPRERLFRFDRLPDALPAKIGFWLFLDSFEHLPSPREFLRWVRRNSARRARILLVAPQAGSFSERVLGRFWPHRLPDHSFHWSKAGISECFAEAGFSLEREFRPKKIISPKMVTCHLAHFCGVDLDARLVGYLPDWSVPFNIGQMGMVFARG